LKYTPHTADDRRKMLERIGVSGVDELFAGIPDDIRLRRPLTLPDPASEQEALALLGARAAANRGADRLVCFAGGGAYDHFSPAIVDQVISRSEYYTAYTPYQAEVSQGTLQSIYEFQSLVCRLFDMEVANASMYDAGSALAETTHMARDITRRSRVLVSDGVHPSYVEVVRTYAAGLGVPVETVPLQNLATDLSELERSLDDTTAACIVQHPNFFGTVEDVNKAAELAHAAGALFIVAADPVSLGVLAPPGSYGADVAVAEGQSLGLPLSFGGPYLGLLAVRRKYVRNMPGRLVGRTADVDGRTGYVLALQTREQHIRRERATSNICTNQALMALCANVWMAWYGREGIKELGRQCLSRAKYLAAAVDRLPGFELENRRPFFKEFTVTTPVPAADIVGRGIEHGILPGLDLGRFDPDWSKRLLVAVTEKRTREDMDRLVEFLEDIGS